MLTPVLVPPTIFHPHVASLPAFHTWVPHLLLLGPSLHACLHASPSLPGTSAPHLPPSPEGAYSGEPPGEVLLFPAPHKGRFGEPQQTADTEASRRGQENTRPPLPGSCTSLAGVLGTPVQALVLAHACLGEAPRAGRDPGVLMSPCSPDQPCGSAGVSCDGQLWQARSPQSVQGHAVQASKAWGGGAEAAADGGRDSTVTNLEDRERHGPTPVSQVGEGRPAAEPVCCGPGAMELDLDPAF